jgi:lipase chaperone LimK
MKKNMIIAGAGIIIILIIAVQIFTRHKSAVGINIMDDNQSIKAEDYKILNRIINFEDGSAGKYFSRLTANQYTIKFFKYLQYKYSKMSFDESLEAVEKYLRSIMDPDKADEMVALYKKFANFEKDFTGVSSKWAQPKNTEEMLQYLRDVQEYRRTYFGKELADELYGTMVKSQEYGIRKSTILNDTTQFGAEKEKQLKELKSQMWGSDASVLDSESEPFDRYQEKLSIYNKDLSLLADNEKKQRIRDYRSEFFTPEVVVKLEKIDDDAAMEKQKEDDYRKLEQKIMSDSSLSKEEKNSRIYNLQNDTFGSEEAEEFRRRENIKSGTENIK